MRQMNVIYTLCLGGIALAFCWLYDIFPFFATLGFLAILGYVAFAPETAKKENGPAEPWYMK